MYRFQVVFAEQMDAACADALLRKNSVLRMAWLTKAFAMSNQGTFDA